jgi:hypothetical protein
MTIASVISIRIYCSSIERWMIWYCNSFEWDCIVNFLASPDRPQAQGLTLSGPVFSVLK